MKVVNLQELSRRLDNLKYEINIQELGIKLVITFNLGIFNGRPIVNADIRVTSREGDYDGIRIATLPIAILKYVGGDNYEVVPLDTLPTEKLVKALVKFDHSKIDALEVLTRTS